MFWELENKGLSWLCAQLESVTKVVILTGRGGGSSSTCLTGFGASTGLGSAPMNVGGSCEEVQYKC
jgi:hypothetical protein